MTIRKKKIYVKKMKWKSNMYHFELLRFLADFLKKKKKKKKSLLTLKRRNQLCFQKKYLLPRESRLHACSKSNSAILFF